MIDPNRTFTLAEAKDIFVSGYALGACSLADTIVAAYTGEQPKPLDIQAEQAIEEYLKGKQ